MVKLVVPVGLNTNRFVAQNLLLSFSEPEKFDKIKFFLANCKNYLQNEFMSNVRRQKKIIVKILVLLLSVFYSVNAQENTANNRWETGLPSISTFNNSFTVSLSPDEELKMELLWKEIGEDLKTEQNDLAGTFINNGNSNGYFLRWSVNKGFILIPYWDYDWIAEFSYGKVSVNHLEVTFIPERDLTSGRVFKKTPQKWTIVENRFMPIEMIKDFGLYRAGFGEYNDFNGWCCEFIPRFLNRKVKGKTFSSPTPKQYLKFIKEPIRGKITFVGKKKLVKEWGYDGLLYGQLMYWTALIPVKVNIKRSSGIKKNMLLRLIDQPSDQYLQVTKVSENYTEGFVVRGSLEEKRKDFKETYFDYEANQDKPLPPIRIGMRVTTSPMID